MITNCTQLFDAVAALGATQLLVKWLAPNDNTKNQIYLAGDLSSLGKIPSGSVLLKPASSAKLPSSKRGPIFHAPLRLFWLSGEGEVEVAPGAKLIVYPQYPEVRLSGFISGCRIAPSALFDIGRAGRQVGRVLLLAPLQDGRIIAAAYGPEHPITKELNQVQSEPYGVFRFITIGAKALFDSEGKLLSELARIHGLGWIDSKRLSKAGMNVCKGTNCGGYTLEAELGITANGSSDPDFHGWEVKQHGVRNFLRPRISPVTLLTPEPSGGIYVEQGVEAFVRRWGYPDTKGRIDRLNIGGVYRCDRDAHARTGLRLVLRGFDSATGAIEGEGALVLVDAAGVVAASWSFGKLMDHWKRKHAKAVYVPSISRMSPSQQYRYGSEIMIAEGASFRKFLGALAAGGVYYDPGIKLEGVSSAAPEAKRRSQFRIVSTGLVSLYERSRSVVLTAPIP